MAYTVAELKELVDHLRARGVRHFCAEGVEVTLAPQDAERPAGGVTFESATKTLLDHFVVGRTPSGDDVLADPMLFAHEGGE